MSRILLVPDLALERWPSMDRYAAELARRIPEVVMPEEARTLGGPRYLARYVRYPRTLRRYRPAVVHVADHSYAHCLGAFPGVPSVVTIHDLHLLRTAAERTGSPRLGIRNALLRWVAKWIPRATAWIAVSRFTASEAARLLGLALERIDVIPNGVDAGFFRRPPDSALAARRLAWGAGISATGPGGTHVILNVGSCEERKNVAAAIRALGVLRRRGLAAKLVQIGGAFGARERRAIGDAGVEGDVLEEPFVDEAGLIAAYFAADAIVLPSTYEGFGLPALEALAARLPVVTSGAGGLAETVGDAALLVPGAEPAALADALERVLTDGATRSGLRERGMARARSLTWDESARRTREVYARVGAGS